MLGAHNSFVLKGDIAFSEDLKNIKTIKDGYVVSLDGICMGAFDTLPKKYEELEVIDYKGSLIVPGMVDLHAHAPQYLCSGIATDNELLDWLNKYIFPEEAKYSDLEYAKKSYQNFTNDMKRGFTTRASIFGTMHTDATILLMDLLEETGIVSYVGKVNMDRNSVDALTENSEDESLEETRRWLQSIEGKYTRTFPILTPRFIPSCSDGLMKGLGELSKEKGLRIQSHLSENVDEVKWVQELVPESTSYANAYELFNAIGEKSVPSIMAHCVYSDDEEIRIMKEHGTFIAHCADSNINLASGIAPIRRFLNEGLKVGIGSDVAAGSTLNMLRMILVTIQASKMYYRLVDSSLEPLTFEEAFYLATLGGGEYFGKVGTFKEGYAFDAVVISDENMAAKPDNVRQRLEKICYNDADAVILSKYVDGKNIFLRHEA